MNKKEKFTICRKKITVILSIYRFKRDDFLSENGMFGSQTFIQYGHNF